VRNITTTPGIEWEARKYVLAIISPLRTLISPPPKFGEPSVMYFFLMSLSVPQVFRGRGG
jgi:hypothetical protein